MRIYFTVSKDKDKGAFISGQWTVHTKGVESDSKTRDYPFVSMCNHV